MEISVDTLVILSLDSNHILEICRVSSQGDVGPCPDQRCPWRRGSFFSKAAAGFQPRWTSLTPIDLSHDSDDDDFDKVDRYINIKISFSKDDSLLEWWSKHSLIFPQLSLLAKSLIGVPASSTTSEHVFSLSGRVLERRRQPLSPDIVDDILVIRNFRNM
jgi:hypothetical protein